VTAEFVEAALSPLLVTLSVAFVWPQVARSFRSVEGLSLASIAQSIVGSWLWVIYGARIGTLPLVLANASAGIGFGCVLANAVRKGAVTRGRAFALVAVLLAAYVLQAKSSAALLGWVAIGVGATGILPQVRRTFAAHDHDGVSRPTYMMVVALTTGWSIFGILDDNWLIVYPNFVILPCALYVLAKTRQTPARRAADSTKASTSATV
jgi:uncharacterized protein with PQ loop repeat